jgi:hypothetical protein
VDYRKKKKSTQGKFPAAQTQESHNLTAGGRPPLHLFHGPLGRNHSCKGSCDKYPRKSPYLLEQVFTLYNAQDEREYFVCIGPWGQATHVGN